MIRALWSLLWDPASFAEFWAERGPVVLRIALFALGLLVQKGVIPGGDSETGWYASLAAMIAAVGFKGGDKNVNLEARLAEIEKKVNP